MRQSTTTQPTVRRILLGIIALTACQDAPEITQPGDRTEAVSPNAQLDLLTVVGLPRSGLRAHQDMVLTDIHDREYVVQTHTARLSDNAAWSIRPGQEIRIEVSPTDHYVAIVEHVERNDPVEPNELPSVSFYGRLRGTFGVVEVTLQKRGLLGSLGDYTRGLYYDMLPLDTGLVAVTLNDHTRHGPVESGGFSSLSHVCHHIPSLTEDDNTPTQLAQYNVASSETQGAAAATQIDLYMLRTRRVDALVGTTVNWKTRQRINLAFANSNVNATVNIVRSGPVTYEEGSKSFQTMAAELANATDGIIDGIHDSRDESMADVVLLFVDRNDSITKGIACAIMATRSTAFAVIEHDWSAGSDTNVGPHELGHLMGGWHDDESDPTPFPYGRGRWHLEEGWATIMKRTPLGTINFFSNPNIAHPSTGTPLGTSSRNMARALNEAKYEVSNFRRPLMISVAGPGTVRPNQLCFWNAEVPAGSGNPPFSYEWRVNGVPRGTSSGFTWRFTESSGLSVTVTDENDRTSGWGRSITVDPNGPPC